MLRRFAIVVVILALVFPIGLVAGASPDETTVRVITIPEWSTEIAPGVFSLGTVIYQDRTIQGLAYVHYDESVEVPDKRCGFGKPGTICGNGICEPGENKRNCPQDCGGNGGNGGTGDCYAFLAKGAIWKTTEPWMVNPTNDEGLDHQFIKNNLDTDIQKWEDAAGVDILGSGSITYQILEEDWFNPDGANEVLFGSINEPGAIALTIVWGYFTGPPPWRELVEWDQVYDQVDYDWSDDGDPNRMDFENIATHELGHAVGLADLYTSECSEMTMYGIAENGETKKRSLEDGDINGVKELYK